MNQPMLLIGEAIAQAAAIASVLGLIWLVSECIKCVRWYDQNVDDF